MFPNQKKCDTIKKSKGVKTWLRYVEVVVLK